VLFRMPSAGAPGPFLSLPGGDGPLLVADRTFVLAPVVSVAAVAGQRSPEVWVVLLAGMLFVLLLEGVLLVAAARPREPLFDLAWSDAQAGQRR
jgi:hypothetical protein